MAAHDTDWRINFKDNFFIPSHFSQRLIRPWRRRGEDKGGGEEVNMNLNEKFMRFAIEEALAAAEMDEVPIGAVAVADDQVVSGAHNIREATGNPLGHAELLLIEKLTSGHHGPVEVPGAACHPEQGEVSGARGWRLENITVYVTCEPCIMCMGALLQARVPRLVFGCPDPKAGACGSLYNLADDTRLNHRIEVVSGVLADECGQLLKDFFKKLR